VVHRADLAAGTGAGAADERSALLLESLGYVDRVLGPGGDPTIAYVGIEVPNGRSDEPEGDAALVAGTAYCIPGWGRRAAFAEAVTERQAAPA
jgi:hypothetical protein